MPEKLHFNILTFDWPEENPTFYFIENDIEGSHPIYKSKWSDKIKDAFPHLVGTDTENLYTTFERPVEGGIPIKIEMYRKELNIYKQYVKHRIRTHFLSKGYVVKKNFVREIEVWLPEKKPQNPLYTSHYKFSIKVQFTKVSKYPELVISFDGITKVMNASIDEMNVDTLILKHFVYRQSVQNYQKLGQADMQEVYNDIDFTHAYPILNNELMAHFEIPRDTPDFGNRYDKFLKNVYAFAKAELWNDEFKKVIPVYDTNFIKVPKNRINHIDPINGLLQFGNKKTGLVPKREMNRNNPYQRPKGPPNIKFLFVHHESHQETIRLFVSYLKKGLGQKPNSQYPYFFQGLEKYINIKAEFAKHHFIPYKNLNDPIPDIKKRLEELDFDHEKVRYAAFYTSPIDKYTPNLEDRLIYAQVKELMLKEKIVVQALDYQTMVENINNKNTYQYHLQNMSLAIHAKLGGIPWKLAATDKKELVIGVGAYTFQRENKRYIASAFSFQNNGIFRSFDYFDETTPRLLAGSICDAIRDFSSQQQPDKIVIHFFKDMKREEAEHIQQGMRDMDLKVPLYILNINKTETQDLIAYDTGWKDLMPKSGTFINIGRRDEYDYLLFNNSRYEDDNKYSNREGYPFPIRIKISSPNEDAFEDMDIVKELLTQVYQFSRLYWKSLRQQNVPVTIKYPEMVAQIAPKFRDGIPDKAKDKLWFL